VRKGGGAGHARTMADATGRAWVRICRGLTASEGLYSVATCNRLQKRRREEPRATGSG
jgi:hypothetical protein